MATVHERMQRIIRQYKDETGKKEVEMRDVAEWAHARGWPLPIPVDPLERLAREFARAAREETREDSKTGFPYRVNHAVTRMRPDGQTVFFWVDIDEAPRPHMQKSAQLRREQMVGDGYQLTLDLDHWNRIHPEEEPIRVSLDFTEDVEERKHAPSEGEEAV